MDHREVGKYWNDNAEAWTELTRSGYDVYRDFLNTPSFLAMLPDLDGAFGLDIGCGEGHNTRLMARRGARIVGIDIADQFLHHARKAEEGEPIGIEYRQGSATELPFADNTFDFATAIMSLMDVPEPEKALSEAYRVIKPNGFLQFSISHPCFYTAHRRNCQNEEGMIYAVEVGDYFRNQNGDITEWTFKGAPAEVKERCPTFKIPKFTRTLGQWINMVVDTGFLIERVEEPCPSEETLTEQPRLQDATVVAFFLHVRGRKFISPTER